MTSEQAKAAYHDNWGMPADARLLEAYDRGAREALERAAEDFKSGQLTGIFIGRDDYPKAWLLSRAADYREGE